jgi:hypothetical protein
MRVFTSHTVPDPIVHDISAAEDLSTALVATREALMPIFEVLETIEEESAGNTLMNNRVRAASNQLHIVDERLAGHSDMAYAIFSTLGGVEAQLEGVAPEAVPMTFRAFTAKWFDPDLPSRSTLKRHTDRLRWFEAVEACERELQVSATMPTTDDEQVSQQADRTAEAYHRMLALRAPTPAEARRKLMIMRNWECGCPSGRAWESIVADMEALIATV